MSDHDAAPGTLTITYGLPGSGKTTAACTWVAVDPTGRARVNRDELRAMMHNSVYLPATDDSQGTEHIIVTAQLAQIATLLRTGVDVVCDDTNLKDAAVAGLRRCAEEVGAPVAVWDLTDVPIEECIRRDAARERPVGEQVIRHMHATYLEAA